MEAVGRAHIDVPAVAEALGRRVVRHDHRRRPAVGAAPSLQVRRLRVAAAAAQVVIPAHVHEEAVAGPARAQARRERALLLRGFNRSAHAIASILSSINTSISAAFSSSSSSSSSLLLLFLFCRLLLHYAMGSRTGRPRRVRGIGPCAQISH